MRDARLDTGAGDALVLAVHEAVANGMEHGSASSVVVEGRVEESDLVVEITTEGAWRMGPGSHSLLDERGRGLALMRELTSGLDVLVDGERVTLRLRVPAGRIEERGGVF